MQCDTMQCLVPDRADVRRRADEEEGKEQHDLSSKQYVYIYIYMCVCVCIYIYIEREREIDRYVYYVHLCIYYVHLYRDPNPVVSR